MDNRITVRPLGNILPNENAMISAKSQMEPTPKKLPFSDATNKDLLKSALKLKNTVLEKHQLKQEQGLLYPKTTDEPSLDYSFNEIDDTPFVFPPDNNCFCCGDERKTDAQIWGEKLALPNDFLEKVLSVDVRLDEHFAEPWTPNNSPLPSPIFFEQPPLSPPVLLEPPFLFLEDLDHSTMYRSALDTSDIKDNDDTDSILEVPDCDLDFTLEDVVSKLDDNSIIITW